MRRFFRVLPLLAVTVLFPVTVHAQATIAGTVRDASGAVLPGVTVEVASPALIEKARTVVTDGVGQYRVVDLRPGTYRGDVYVAGLQHAEAGRDRGQPARRLHHQCGDARRRRSPKRSPSPGTRRSSTCRACAARRC